MVEGGVTGVAAHEDGIIIARRAVISSLSIGAANHEPLPGGSRNFSTLPHGEVSGARVVADDLPTGKSVHANEKGGGGVDENMD